MGDHFEHVGYRYRPPEGVALYLDGRWSFAPDDAEYDMEQLADRGWQVERLYRRCKDE